MNALKTHLLRAVVLLIALIALPCAMPGQALAYKIGQLKISAIRARAEKTLGNKFDLRAFHDEILKDGALPLDLLEAKMDSWIARKLE